MINLFYTLIEMINFVNFIFLGIWGFHDRLLNLRRALHSFLSNGPARHSLWRRWQRQQTIMNSLFGLVYTEQEWRREWNAIVNMASTIPRMRKQSASRFVRIYLFILLLPLCMIHIFEQQWEWRNRRIHL